MQDDGLFVKTNRSGKQYWNFRIPLPNGKWGQKSTGIEVTGKKPPAEAIQKRLDALKDKRPQSGKDREKATVAALIDVWLDHQEHKAKLRPSFKGTYNNYKSTAKHPQRPDMLGDRIGASLLVSDLHWYQEQSVAGSKEGGTRTTAQRLYVLNASLAFNKIVVPDVERFIPLKKKSVKKRVALTDEQFNHLFKVALSEKRWRDVAYLALLAVDTCKRPCEIMGLQLGRIIVRHPLLEWVTEDVFNGYRKFVETDDNIFYGCVDVDRDSTKSDDGVRMLPLTQRAHLAIMALLDSAATKKACKPEHYLLPTNLARHCKKTDPLYERRFEGYAPDIPQTSWNTAWDSIRERAGLPWVDFYNLRHTGATVIAEATDIPDEVAIQYSGHADIETLRENYQKKVRMKATMKVKKEIEKSNPKLNALLGLTNEGTRQ